MTEEELRKHVKATAKPQGAWGKKHGIPQATISLVANGRKDAPEALLDALGLKRVISYEPHRKPKPSRDERTP